MKRSEYEELQGRLELLYEDLAEQREYSGGDGRRETRNEIEDIEEVLESAVIEEDEPVAPTETKPDYFEELTRDTVNHWTIDYPKQFNASQKRNLELAIARSLREAYSDGRRDADLDGGRDEHDDN